MNLLDYASNQISRFRTKNQVEINDDRNGTYDKKNLKFKTTMLNASLCDYSNSYILVEGRITVAGQGANVAVIATDRNDKEVVFKNCAPFIKCIRKINNAEVDNVEDLDFLIPIYNLLEYSENYAKTSASLWQYCSGEPDDIIGDSKSFKLFFFYIIMRYT